MKQALCIIFVVISLSCSDWLEVRPRTEVTVKEMFTSEQGFKDALTACYIKMNGRNLYGTALIMTTIEYLANHWPSSGVSTRPIKNFEHESADAQNQFAAIYLELYNVIAQANIVLENLDASGHVIEKPALRAIVEAEALAIRAFCHFEVARLFGQLPRDATRTTALPYVEEVSLAPLPYYSFDDFIARVHRDLAAAEALLAVHDPVLDYSFDQLDAPSGEDPVQLEDQFLAYRRFRFNYHAVRALQARVHLYTGQKEAAHDLAMALINARDKAGNKVLSLAGSDDFNRRYYALPSECFLALHNLNIGNLLGSMNLYLTPSAFTGELFAGQSTGTNNRATSAWGTESSGEMTRVVLRKYDQPLASESLTGEILATRRQVVPLLRLSEVYLIAMETSGDLDEVNALYTEYMQARNVMATPLTDARLLEEIISEYRREFYGEGQMFHVYKRLGAKRMLWKTDRDVREEDYVIPLPTSEINPNN